MEKTLEFEISKEQKKLELVKKIKDKIVLKNRYKQSCIKLMAYLHEIDP